MTGKSGYQWGIHIRQCIFRYWCTNLRSGVMNVYDIEVHHPAELPLVVAGEEMCESFTHWDAILIGRRREGVYLDSYWCGQSWSEIQLSWSIPVDTLFYTKVGDDETHSKRHAMYRRNHPEPTDDGMQQTQHPVHVIDTTTARSFVCGPIL